ncbi:MAG TPA: aspartate dehydrogenase [Stellaceae bacterium]|nr:aspartate dehydrogenase [Stellaceae bacterium]
MRLGLIGLGAIGGEVLAAADRGELPGVELNAVLVRRPRPATSSARLVTADAETFFRQRFAAVLECAGHQAVRDHGERVLAGGSDLLVTSAGALTDDALLTSMLSAAERGGSRLIVPSAGIGALDVLAGAAQGGLDEVTVTVRKDPLSWKGTVAEATHDLDRLEGPVTLYDGPVREGARRYPQNVNISAAAALAGIGLDRTRLVIVADPAIATHVVEITARGRFGSFTFREDVIPTESNPKTGRLVAMAVIKTVRQLAGRFVVGG